MKELEKDFLQNWENEKGLVDKQRACMILDVSHTHISNYVKDGKIKSFEHYKKTLYSFRDVIYMRQKREEKRRSKR
jgi:hypothetical protein